MPTFNPSNHQLVVTFTREAATYTRTHIGTLFEAAEEACLKHKAKQVQFHPGIVVTAMEHECMTREDSMSKADRASATCKKLLPELEKLSRPTEKIVREIARGEEFEPVGTMPVVGDTIHLPPHGRFHVTGGVPGCPMEWVIQGNGAVFYMTHLQFKYGLARILRRSAQLERKGARCWKTSCAAGSMYAWVAGKLWHKCNTFAWGASQSRTPEELFEYTNITYTELHGTEAAQILADPELAKLIERA